MTLLTMNGIAIIVPQVEILSHRCHVKTTHVLRTPLRPPYSVCIIIVQCAESRLQTPHTQTMTYVQTASAESGKLPNATKNFNVNNSSPVTPAEDLACLAVFKQ